MIILSNFSRKILWLPGDFSGLKRFIRERARLNRYLRSKVIEHRKNFNSSDIKDYIDAFLLEIENHQNSPPESHYFKGLIFFAH